MEVVVSVDASTGELQWEAERVSGTSTVSVSSESDDVVGRRIESDWDAIELYKRLEDGQLWVDIYTDFTPVATTATTTSGGGPVLVTVGGRLMTTGGIISPNLDLRVGGSLGNIPGIYNGETGHFECAANCVLVTANNVVTSDVMNIMFIPASTVATTMTTTTYSGDSDYLAGGIWVYAPDDADGTEDYEFGAFVDGNDPFTPANLDGLTGEAVYMGDEDVTGVYTDSTTDRNSFFYADVALTANFDTDTISGMISDFHDAADDELVEGNPSLMLEGATGNIDTDANFFTGDTSMTFDGDDFAGKWGGQFYGNGANATDHPGSVAGTFGGANADDTKAFLGVFGADRQP